jgi:hypothetical protein
MAIVVDHASRLVVGVAVFKRRPTSFQVYSFLGTAIRRSGSRPKYIIADKGKESSASRTGADGEESDLGMARWGSTEASRSLSASSDP